jgi:DNA polymerase-1
MLAATSPERVVYVSDGVLAGENLATLSSDGPLGFDLETTGLDPRAGSILLAQFSDGQRTVVLSWRDCRDAAISFLGGVVRAKRELIIQNAKFEYAWILVHAKLRLRTIWDTKLADVILRCGRDEAEMTHGRPEGSSLGDLAYRYLGVKVDKGLQMSFVDADPNTFVPTLEQIQYAAIDAAVVVPLRRTLQRRLDQDGLGEVMRLENRLVPVLAEMELRGMGVSVDKWRGVLTDLDAQMLDQETQLVEVLSPPIIRVRARIYAENQEDRERWIKVHATAKAGLERQSDQMKWESKRERRTWINAGMREWAKEHEGPKVPHLAEGPINLHSNQQVLAALHEIGVDVQDTQGKTLEDYVRHSGSNPMLDLLVAWKSLSKLGVAFGENILAKIHEARLFPEFNQIVSTGRMSMRNPNLMQIPKGERGGAGAEFGKRLRTCFIAPPGRKLICADYSSIEWRLACEMYGEESAIQELMKGEEADPHRAAAATMFNLPQELIGKDSVERASAKTINYGILYGISPYGLAPRLSVSVADAKALLDRWEKAHPALARGLRMTALHAVRDGSTRTKLGRRRLYTVPERPRMAPGEAPDDWREWRRANARVERQAKNAPIQGTSADMTKMALVNIHANLAKYGERAFLVNSVHDEIIAEADDSVAEVVKQIIINQMVTAGQYFLKRVPVLVEAKVATSWTH